MLKRVKDSVSGGLRAAKDRVTDAVFTDVDVPVVLMPTGPNPDDYTVVINMKETAALLGKGKLVRPKLEIWAARDDMDRKDLAERIATAFMSAFRKAKANVRGKKRRTSKQLEADAKAASKALKEDASMVGATIVGVLLVSNPLVDLLFLLIALGAGRDAISNMLSLVRNGAYQRYETHKFNNTPYAVVRDKRLVAIDTIEQLDIRIGENLQSFVDSICQLDGVPGPDPKDAAREEFMLTERQYHAWLNSFEDESHLYLAEEAEIPHH